MYFINIFHLFYIPISFPSSFPLIPLHSHLPSPLSPFTPSTFPLRMGQASQGLAQSVAQQVEVGWRLLGSTLFLRWQHHIRSSRNSAEVGGCKGLFGVGSTDKLLLPREMEKRPIESIRSGSCRYSSPFFLTSGKQFKDSKSTLLSHCFSALSAPFKAFFCSLEDISSHPCFPESFNDL